MPQLLWNFMQQFKVNDLGDKNAKIAQGLFGYCTYDAVQFFETVKLKSRRKTPEIPVMRYRLYQYVIAINHFKDEMFLCENMIKGLESDMCCHRVADQKQRRAHLPFSRSGWRKQQT